MTDFCNHLRQHRQASSSRPTSPKPSPWHTMTRREFLAAAGAAAVTGALWPLGQARGADAGIAPAGNMGELNATGTGGIDLYLERRNLLIGGRPCRAITINGSIPGPARAPAVCQCLDHADHG